jgi:hypothetical protein
VFVILRIAFGAACYSVLKVSSVNSVRKFVGHDVVVLRLEHSFIWC